ncbi:MAG: peptidyl-prolyl cis-trans isomerase [Rhodocyclaceae bacterium]|nr:peptidyl-prolyl cis-trans isomerase [Rhodocyclaceae bacterium]
MPAQVRERFFDKNSNIENLASSLLVRRVLAERATAEGLADDPKVAAELRLVRERVLSDALAQRATDAATPSDETLRQLARTEYNVSRDKLAEPEMVRVRHILIPKSHCEPLAEAQKILEELKGGADFEALAKAHSADPGSRDKGGDLGFFPRGRMVTEFDDVAFSLTEPGQLSDVFETKFGFHIVRFEARKPAHTPAFEEVEAKIREELLQRLRSQALKDMADPVRTTGVPDADAIEAFAQTMRTPGAVKE